MIAILKATAYDHCTGLYTNSILQGEKCMEGYCGDSEGSQKILDRAELAASSGV